MVGISTKQNLENTSCHNQPKSFFFYLHSSVFYPGRYMGSKNIDYKVQDKEAIFKVILNYQTNLVIFEVDGTVLNEQTIPTFEEDYYPSIEMHGGEYEAEFI